MRIAIQIYGSLRNFNECINDILYYIDYNNNNHSFDFFLLIDDKELDDNFKILNKDFKTKINELKEILGDNIKILDYVSNYPYNYIIEDGLNKKYYNLYEKFKNITNINYTINDFVTKLWYRRYFLNNIRKQYQINNNISYDYIIRTRFDINFKYDKIIIDYNNIDNKLILMPDIISVGNEYNIDIESNLGLKYPFIPSYLLDNNFEYNLINNFKDINIDDNNIYNKLIQNYIYDKIYYDKWLFMSEENLRYYLLYNNIDYILHSNFKISRYDF